MFERLDRIIVQVGHEIATAVIGGFAAYAESQESPLIEPTTGMPQGSPADRRIHEAE